MTSRYLTSEQAAAYLNFPSTVAFRSFLQRRRAAGFPVKAHHRGRALLFLPSDLDAVLTVEQSKSRGLRRAG